MHRVIEGLRTHIEGGERVAIIGRSGSGQSTLLNIVSGIDRAEAALLGMADGGVGLLLGTVIGRELIALVSGTINDLYFV